jgi:hypothetical protein
LNGRRYYPTITLTEDNLRLFDDILQAAAGSPGTPVQITDAILKSAREGLVVPVGA